jgi:chromosome segregation ATPase
MLARVYNTVSPPTSSTNDAPTVAALESALAVARTRTTEAEMKVIELERALGEMTIARGKAEARVQTLGERTSSRLAETSLEFEALRGRCETLETANERLRTALRTKSERVDELEAMAVIERESHARVASEPNADADAAAENREKEITRLRGELTRQATVIADAYRDELMKLQSQVAASEAKCKALESAQVKPAKKATKIVKKHDENHRVFGSPYAYASYASKTNANVNRDAEEDPRTPIRSPLTPTNENVFSRLATPKRITPRAAPSPSRFR